MPSPLVQKLTGVRDLKRILETTVREIGDTFQAEACQVMLSNPLDPNVTSICEFKAAPDAPEGETTVTVPLVLQGRTFGSVSVSRDVQLSGDEVNSLRVLLGELGDIIRLAQINDIVQRDTFRETFLVEIGNVMAYSMGIGDALFLVVNILGKALQASRCLFICTDEQQAGWKCYEFWQQDKVASCQEYFWPATDSPLVAQVLLSRTPLKVFEGQENSYVTPVQEELQFVNVKSLLGVALRSEKGTHGCVILQQCDYRRAWTRGETDMVQNVADKVAEALLKLPAEKLAREPIMQLHQRIVTPRGEEEPGQSDVQLRRALKGALGQQAIPSARKTSAPKKPAPAAAQPPQPQLAQPAPVAPPPAPLPPVVAPPAVQPQLQNGQFAAPGQFGAPGQTNLSSTGNFETQPPGQFASGPGQIAADASNQFASGQFAPVSEGQVAPHAEAPGQVGDSVAPLSASPGMDSGVWGPSGALDLSESVQIPVHEPRMHLEVTATLPVADPASFAPVEDLPHPTIKPITRTGRTDTAILKPNVDGLEPRDRRASIEMSMQSAPPPNDDPYADLDFGDVPETAPPAVSPGTDMSPGIAAETSPGMPAHQGSGSLEQTAPGMAVEAPPEMTPEAALGMVAEAAQQAGAPPQAPQFSDTGAPVGAQPPLPGSAAAFGDLAQAIVQQSPGGVSNFVPPGALDSIPAPAAADGGGNGGWTNLDSIPTPAGTAAPAPAWGNLDEIPTPAGGLGGGGGGGGMGLKGSIFGKAKAAPGGSALMSSFRKSRGAEPAAATAAPQAPVAAAPAEPMTDEAAKAKIEKLMSSGSNETSDYIFATPGLDTRLLGRIDGWVTQIESKDRYKNGHARQVAMYAVAIAEELGIKDAELNTIRQAALVHDLGKLGIAQQILQKSDDSLEDDQFVQKMGHAVAGAQLLESFPDLGHLAPIVIAHHEEFDGEGFPQGLKGDEIPSAARIICVANSYHELVALKVYGGGMAPDDAQKQMIEGKNSQYDPVCVDALVAAIKAGKVPPAC